MEKVKNFLYGTNFALLVFLSLATKSLIFNTSLSETLAFGFACAVYGYGQYLKSKQPEPVRINKEIKQEIDNLKGAMNAIKMDKTISKAQKYF